MTQSVPRDIVSNGLALCSSFCDCLSFPDEATHKENKHIYQEHTASETAGVQAQVSKDVPGGRRPEPSPFADPLPAFSPPTTLISHPGRSLEETTLRPPSDNSICSLILQTQCHRKLNIFTASITVEGKWNTFLSFLERLLVLYEEFSRQEVSPKASNKPILASRKRHSGIIQRERELCVSRRAFVSTSSPQRRRAGTIPQTK